MSAFLSSTSTGAGQTGQELVNDITINNPPEDLIQDMSFLPQQDLLAVASWDNKVRIYEIDANSGNNQGRALYEHGGPVFSARWSPDGQRVVSGGADKQVKLFDLALQQLQQIGAHDGPVKSVRYVEVGPSNTPVVVSGSWDKTVKYWDTRSPTPVLTLQMPERVYDMDSAGKLLVVATADRHFQVVDLNNPQQVFKNMTSALKWQTRCVSCLPTGDGFAIGSIEGRCAIVYVDDQRQKVEGFLFRCHRKTQQGGNPNSLKATGDVQVYAINLISFHSTYGTFLTAGSDGTFCYWDGHKDARQRLKFFPNVNSPITSACFNKTGTIFAYALSYDWSKGHQMNRPDQQVQIKLHGVKDDEIKPKKRR